jgi:hypothetical protein
MTTTTSGGARQTVRRTKPTSAMPKSPGVLTELVQRALVQTFGINATKRSGRLCHVRGFYLSIERGALNPHVYISMH